MKRKPTSQGGYGPADLARAFSACLQAAEGLGEELMAHVTVVGGLAPYLLVPPDKLPRDTRHVGTLDLDLGMAVASSQEPSIYDRISRRLIDSGFSPERDGKGRGQLEWRWPATGVAMVTLDFIADAEIRLPRSSC